MTPSRAYNSARRPVLPLAAVLLATAVAVPQASADNGGVSFERPEVKALLCADGTTDGCPRGALLRIKGAGLERTKIVRFLGGKGKRDDRSARPIARSDHRVVVKVPAAARTGKVTAVVQDEVLQGPRLNVLPAEEPAPQTRAVGYASGVFPLTAEYSYGSATNSFGGGRGHQGQDILTRCDARIRAVYGGEVHYSGYQSAAGNYLVINADDGSSQTYMHMAEPSPLKKGDTVLAGERIGNVGQTGRASTCHLHFELWTAPGWYQGGRATNPRPLLNSLASGDAVSAQRR